MRVHNAVWSSAEQCGNDWARRYAHDRKAVPETQRTKMDSKWLLGHGSKRLRDLWFAVPVEDRQLMLERTPDVAFPFDCTGVLDERRKARTTPTNKPQATTKPTTNPKEIGKHKTKLKPTKRTSTKSAKVVKSFRESDSKQNDDGELHKRLVLMRSARAKYHKIASTEHLLQLQTAYG
ncbi:hypothetical protein PR001_g25166 [Phytophthora rubi]|uniref:Uncharacterized protein n=1 Tax=Phytophthora rubi TaxID=129364 RepID=A0A6A3I595_9STRA|nr:hypothetical protein PR002_g25612 [Phytophthora rubi]KAE8977311.1 hypothetical protein PR001_g25166 [Phytophthora rubi]